jgi:hypothetical protein
MSSTKPLGIDRLAQLSALHLYGMATAWSELLSMAARNSPESSGRNSPVHSDLVTAKPSRQCDIGEAVEVEIDDFLKRLSDSAVAQAFGQRVGPGGILGL